MQDTPFDIAIVGACIVGAAVAHFLAPAARVLLLESEAAAGTQATGRSAALFEPAYGPPQVRALTRASRAFFDSPPPGFCRVPLLRPRPGLFVGTAADEASLRALHARLNEEGLPSALLSGDEARQRVPVLRPEACTLALLDPSSSDIDVDALLQGYLRSARHAGAQVALQARLTGAEHDGGHDDDHPAAAGHLGGPAQLRGRRRAGAGLRPAGPGVLLGGRAGRLRHPEQPRRGGAVRRVAAGAAASRRAGPGERRSRAAGARAGGHGRRHGRVDTSPGAFAAAA